MAEQALDVRATLTLLRRHRFLVVAVILVGALAGVALAYLRPPLYSSVSMVLLPSGTEPNGEPVVRDPSTETRIASSDVVLGPAGEQLEPSLTAAEVREHVRIDASTNDVLTIEASASSPELAEDLAAAVAQAEIAYVAAAATKVDAAGAAVLEERRETLQQSLKSVNAEIARTTQVRDEAGPDSPERKSANIALAQLTAQQADLLLQIDKLSDQQREGTSGDATATATEIQAASPATRPKATVHYALHAAGGAGAALVLMILLMSMVMRKDRRLRLRDEIADAVGSPVLASVRSQAQRSVAGWTNLMQSYEPSTVDAWALRLTLRQLFPHLADGKARGRGEDHAHRTPASVTVVSLANDSRALAVAPQLASYAAASGLRTRLVAAQRHESAASLWAACHRDPGQEEVRPGLLVETSGADATTVDLTVVMVVIDRRKPELVTPLQTDVTLVCLSPGDATADDLARVAVVVDDAGRRLSGVIVANPDSLDPTSGRLLQTDRVGQASLPTHLTGAPTIRSVGPAGGHGGEQDLPRARDNR